MITLLFMLLTRNPFDSVKPRSFAENVTESAIILKSSTFPFIPLRFRWLKSILSFVFCDLMSVSLNAPSLRVTCLNERVVPDFPFDREVSDSI